MTYCSKCDTNYEGYHDNCSVGIKARPTGSLSVYANEVWNEAIEAAALEVVKTYPVWSNEIRKLKK